MKTPPQTFPAMPAETAKAPEQVGHLISRWAPGAEAMPIPAAPPDTLPLQVDEPKPRMAGDRSSQQTRAIADPFNPDDDRANCLRCGYAVEPGREVRGLTTCAACADRGTIR